MLIKKKTPQWPIIKFFYHFLSIEKINYISRKNWTIYQLSRIIFLLMLLSFYFYFYLYLFIFSLRLHLPPAIEGWAQRLRCSCRWRALWLAGKKCAATVTNCIIIIVHFKIKPINSQYNKLYSKHMWIRLRVVRSHSTKKICSIEFWRFGSSSFGLCRSRWTQI